MGDAAIRYGDAPVVGRARPVLALLGDDRLVDQVGRGSHAAFEALYERHHRGMLAFCRHMLGSSHDAEEAVQQSFTVAYSDLSSGERPTALKPWLYGIARHRCLEMLRKRRNQVDAEASREGVSAALTEEVERRSELREMLTGVSRLPEPQRTALVLFGLCGHPQADVAAVLDCDEARVRALVYQARTSLLEDRRARDTPCHEIREKLALGHGGALRRRAVRRHVKFCPSCAEFRAEVLRQRRLMGFAAPAIPSAGLKAQVLAAAGLASSAGAGGGSAAGLGGLLGTAKVVTAALVLTATPVGGGMLLRGATDRRSPARSGSPHASPHGGQAALAGSAGASATQRPVGAPPDVGTASVPGSPAPARRDHPGKPAGPHSSLGSALGLPSAAGDARDVDGRHGARRQAGERSQRGAPTARASSTGQSRHADGARAGGHGRASRDAGGANPGHDGGGHGHADRPGRSPPSGSPPPSAPAQQPPADSKPARPCPVPAVTAGPVNVESGCPVNP